MADRTPRGGQAIRFFAEHVNDRTAECVVWPFASTKGYGTAGGEYVHVLACIAWHGPRPDGMHATHGPCRNPLCFNGAHLSWQTPAGNNADKQRDGTDGRGERNTRAKLTAAQVLAIRARYDSGENLGRIAVDYGVSHATICVIGQRKRWAHLSRLPFTDAQ
jgi:hypothetical protein